MAKAPPCNAGDADWIPGLGTKITHGVEQLSRSTPSTEPMDHNSRVHVLQRKISHDTAKTCVYLLCAKTMLFKKLLKSLCHSQLLINGRFKSEFRLSTYYQCSKNSMKYSLQFVYSLQEHSRQEIPQVHP